MLKIYGAPLSSPANKVCYVANYLNMPYEFHKMNLMAKEHLKPEFLEINPLGKIPAINDHGFTLGESNAIIRYLANKQNSPLYPVELQQRALVDQWLDYAAQHVMAASSKVMGNTYFYKLRNVPQDTRSLEEGLQFLNQYLLVLEKQLTKHAYIAGGDQISLADIALLASLDCLELIDVSLSDHPYLENWRNTLMKMSFYTKLHSRYQDIFNTVMPKLIQTVT